LNHSRHFSPRQLRILRKEMLVLRASVERAEVAQAGQELRRKFTHFGWLKWLAPTWAAGTTELGNLGSIMSKYPMLSSVLSLAMSTGLRHTALRLVKPAAKVGVAAFAGWSAWKVWRSVQSGEFDVASERDSE
jgi:hypothetical protein